MTAGTMTRPPAAPRRRRPVTPVHDRIAARRDEIEQTRARRRLRWLIAIAAVLLLVLGGLLLNRSPVLAVTRFDIDLGGAQHLGVAQVKLVAGVHPHTPMASIEVDAVAGRLAALPWVESATVIRSWPHTLAIRIIERTAVGQVPAAAGGWLLVDESGQLLERRPDPSPGVLRLDVPPVAGLPGSNIGPAGRDVLALGGRLPPELVQRLAELRGSGTGLEATIATGGTVRFCGTANLADKLLALSTMLVRVDPAQIGTLDVCVPSAPVLTPPPRGA